MRLLQLIVFVAAGCGLVWLRDNDPELREPLSNGYLVGLLSIGAAFVFTLAVILPGELLTRIRRIHGDAKRRRLLKAQKRL
jgi:hypothetical protein